jgi:hypothetical protein
LARVFREMEEGFLRGVGCAICVARNPNASAIDHPGVQARD